MDDSSPLLRELAKNHVTCRRYGFCTRPHMKNGCSSRLPNLCTTLYPCTSLFHPCTSPYPCTAPSQWARIHGCKLQERPRLAALQDMCNLCASCIRQTSTPVPRRFRQAALSFRQICDSVYPSGTMNVNSPFAIATLTCPSLGSKVQVPPPLSLWLHSPPPVSPFIFT